MEGLHTCDAIQHGLLILVGTLTLLQVSASKTAKNPRLREEVRRLCRKYMTSTLPRTFHMANDVPIPPHFNSCKLRDRSPFLEQPAHLIVTGLQMSATIFTSKQVSLCILFCIAS